MAQTLPSDPPLYATLLLLGAATCVVLLILMYEHTVRISGRYPVSSFRTIDSAADNPPTARGEHYTVDENGVLTLVSGNEVVMTAVDADTRFGGPGFFPGLGEISLHDLLGDLDALLRDDGAQATQGDLASIRAVLRFPRAVFAGQEDLLRARTFFQEHHTPFAAALGRYFESIDHCRMPHQPF